MIKDLLGKQEKSRYPENFTDENDIITDENKISEKCWTFIGQQNHQLRIPHMHFFKTPIQYHYIFLLLQTVKLLDSLKSWCQQAQE